MHWELGRSAPMSPANGRLLIRTWCSIRLRAVPGSRPTG